ncbi:heavy metal translocating P-type ATPase [Shimia sp. NS0008-38b]|uniref:heavy metal translocating P-type ATPase n=1 Tax=Shimia sp. NS0008-38b TaxID=3127653 RepID=UPI003101BF9F
MTTLTFQIEGLSCAGCVARAEKALGGAAGVQAAQVNLADETARVDVDGALQDVVGALQKAGYPAREQGVVLDVAQMTCAGCVRRVEQALANGPGVLSAEVNFASETATVRYLEGAITPEDLAALSAKAGYPAQLPQAEGATADRKADEVAQLRRDVCIAAVLALPVFVVEMGAHLFPPFHHWLMAHFSMSAVHMAQWALTTILLAGPGRQFYLKGFPALFRGAPEMNSLVAIGTGAAYVFSVVSTFAPGWLPTGTANVYFEAAAVIVVLILVGRWMEARAKGRTGEAIRQLMQLQPPVARVERHGGVQEVPIAQVVVGDVLHLRPGERVAVDGHVLDGHSYVDESMMSGEPTPVAKSATDAVVGGTINGQGSLRYRAEKVGADTILSQIIALVRDTQGAKLPVQARVDRITAVFVPVVIGIAALTFFVWLMVGPQPAFGHSVVAAVAVLIIACPCAMGLATPTSIMVGTGRAAQLGVLFRKGEALQGAQACRVVAFDKTGTLTKGLPSLTDFHVTPGHFADEVLRLAASAEQGSEHPLARALVQAAETRGMALAECTAFEAHVGFGVSGTVQGQRVMVGAQRFMAAEKLDASHLHAQAAALAEQGKTPIFVAVDRGVVAVVAVSDPVKPSAKATIKALQARGLSVAMISGDARQTAKALAAQLGVDHVVAEVMPAGKVDAIETLRTRFGPVAFVGDGINDAPALAAADVGVAIGTGTDVAIEAADVVLMSGDVRGVVTAYDLSQRVMRNIGQNLFWAFGYNVALIPVAAGVLVPLGGPALSPMFGAGAMALSSVFVLSNALRLRRVQPALAEEKEV